MPRSVYGSAFVLFTFSAGTLATHTAMADSATVAFDDSTSTVLSRADCTATSQTALSLTWTRTDSSGGSERACQSAVLARDAGIVRVSVFAEYRYAFWRGASGLRLDGGAWAGGLALGF